MLNRKPVVLLIEDDENMNAARDFIGKPYRLDELCRKVKALAEPGNTGELMERAPGCRAPRPQKRA